MQCVLHPLPRCSRLNQDMEIGRSTLVRLMITFILNIAVNITDVGSLTKRYIFAHGIAFSPLTAANIQPRRIFHPLQSRQPLIFFARTRCRALTPDLLRTLQPICRTGVTGMWIMNLNSTDSTAELQHGRIISTFKFPNSLLNNSTTCCFLRRTLRLPASTRRVMTNLRSMAFPFLIDCPQCPLLLLPQCSTAQ